MIVGTCLAFLREKSNVAPQKPDLGQVVYVVTDTKQRIVPGILVEELVNRTIDGTRVTYVVQVGHEQKAKFEEDKVYPTLKRAREVILQKFTTNLDKLLESAELLAKEWYPDKIKQSEPEQLVKRQSKRPSMPPLVREENNDLPSQNVENNVQTVQVRMPDGTIANVKIPSNIT